MFYKMIDAAREKWYKSKECTVNNIIDYIVATGQMRDAQIEAYKNIFIFKN